MLYLTARGGTTPIFAREIAKAVDVPYYYLAKVLHQLTRTRLLVSHRGLSGGFSLARPAKEISLQDVIISIDGQENFDDCLLGIPFCHPDHPCPIHYRWTETRNTVLTFLQESTIDKLSKELESSMSRTQPSHHHDEERHT